MKRLIVLDLDNTLIYCTYSSGHKVKMLFEYKDSLSVYERPYATEFVQRLIFRCNCATCFGDVVPQKKE